MSISLNSLSTGNVQSIGTTPFEGAGSKTRKAGNIDTDALTAVPRCPDDSRLSPFAKMTITLRYLQQSDPTKYQQVTQQIATSLQGAAQTAESNGHPIAAAHVNQLADVFTSASQSGQLPNLQDLAQAVGISHPYLLHHHRGSDTVPTNSDATSSAGGSSSSASGSCMSPTASESLSAFQTDVEPQSDALVPMDVILNTMSNAGITGSDG
jgi:hypothetical protein